MMLLMNCTAFKSARIEFTRFLRCCKWLQPLPSLQQPAAGCNTSLERRRSRHVDCAHCGLPLSMASTLKKADPSAPTHYSTTGDLCYHALQASGALLVSKSTRNISQPHLVLGNQHATFACTALFTRNFLHQSARGSGTFWHVLALHPTLSWSLATCPCTVNDTSPCPLPTHFGTLPDPLPHPYSHVLAPPLSGTSWHYT
jgi:hypothetical protein